MKLSASQLFRPNNTGKKKELARNLPAGVVLFITLLMSLADNPSFYLSVAVALWVFLLFLSHHTAFAPALHHLTSTARWLSDRILLFYESLPPYSTCSLIKFSPSMKLLFRI